jgi:C-terminal processing protease CtpA/Prc
MTLLRHLPNGWTFGLPNEIYLTKVGKAFDRVGVPPDIEVPIIPA